MRTVLPFHSPVDPDELAALIVLEHITRREFYKREKPDLNSVDNKIGVEVIRAYLPEYERHNGKIISDELKGGYVYLDMPSVGATINTIMVIPYKQFDVILLECADMFVIWDWNNNSLMFRPDAFDEYKNQCYNVFHLISDEIDNGVSAVDNTPLKCMNRLFSERCED